MFRTFLSPIPQYPRSPYLMDGESRSAVLWSLAECNAVRGRRKEKGTVAAVVVGHG